MYPSPVASRTAAAPCAQVVDTIFEQHEALRTLLESARRVAGRVAGGDDSGVSLLPHLLLAVRISFGRHLETEERLLLPILQDDWPLGPERARRLVEEHTRQRAEIAALWAASINGDVATVARRLMILADDLLEDMQAEERTLRTPDYLRDDVVSIDQNSG
jgi:iron-sulfur cluster repair protein YtfE (RIC family)